MFYLIAFIIFVFGLFVGSFLNVAVDRFPRGEGIIGGRSYCEYCKKVLAWYDLIPVLSFISSGGKCRYCRKKLSFYYPVIELSTAVMFLLTYIFVVSNFKFQISSGILSINYFTYLAYYLFIVSCLIIVFFDDLKYGIIPDRIVYPAIIISAVYLIAVYHLSFAVYLLSGIGAFLFFSLLFLITKGKGMGLGDLKLSFLLGLVLGYPGIILALYVAFLTGGFAGLILIIWKKKASIKDTIPFGPFLVFGTILSIFLGNQIFYGILSFLGI